LKEEKQEPAKNKSKVIVKEPQHISISSDGTLKTTSLYDEGPKIYD